MASRAPSDDDLELIRLRLSGLTNAEIGGALGAAPSTISRRLVELAVDHPAVGSLLNAAGCAVPVPSGRGDHLTPKEAEAVLGWLQGRTQRNVGAATQQAVFARQYAAIRKHPALARLIGRDGEFSGCRAEVLAPDEAPFTRAELDRAEELGLWDQARWTAAGRSWRYVGGDEFVHHADRDDGTQEAWLAGMRLVRANPAATPREIRQAMKRASGRRPFPGIGNMPIVTETDEMDRLGIGAARQTFDAPATDTAEGEEAIYGTWRLDRVYVPGADTIGWTSDDLADDWEIPPVEPVHTANTPRAWAHEARPACLQWGREPSRENALAASASIVCANCLAIVPAYYVTPVRWLSPMHLGLIRLAVSGLDVAGIAGRTGWPASIVRWRLEAVLRTWRPVCFDCWGGRWRHQCVRQRLSDFKPKVTVKRTRGAA